MSYLQSSQNFVRALKALNDPPSADSPVKIDIAREVWDGSSINTQNKAKAIVDHILTRLLKDKGKTADSPVGDQRYWKLLSSVLNTLPLSGSSAASTRAWLIPLLNRVPLVPICTSLLEVARGLNQASSTVLLDDSAQAISTLWSVASPKFTPDALLDSFGALLSVAAHLSDGSIGLSRIGAGICASLLEGFNNSSNKKKLHQLFTHVHLQRWVVCIAHVDDLESSLRADLYRAGQEILFNADTFKSLTEPSSLKALFATLPVSEASLTSLPKLLRAFAAAARKNQALFGQKNIAAPTAARGVAMLFYTQCLEYMHSAPNELSEVAWTSRLALLQVIEDNSLLGFGQADGSQAIRKDVNLYVDALPLSGTLNPHSALILDALSVVSRIDHNLLEPQLPELLPRLLIIPSLPHPAAASALNLLALCISYHSRARSLSALLEYVQGVFASLTSHQGSIRALYPRAAGSPLLAHSFTTALAKAVQTFVTPGQVLPIAQGIVAVLERAYGRFSSLALESIGDGGAGPRKKARRSHSSTNIPTTLDTSGLDGAAVSFASLARIGASVLPALPIQTLTPEVQEDVKAHIHRADFIRGELFGAMAQDGDNRRTDVWAAHVVLAAGLRLLYALRAAPRLGFPPSQLERQQSIVEVHRHSNILPELFLETSRYLLKTATSAESAECLVVFDRILLWSEKHLKIPSAWNGRSAELAYDDDGASQAATGLLRLLLDRFIDVFDSTASEAHLYRLAELLFKAAAASSPHAASGVLTPAVVARDCLRSSQLWEQRRLRTFILSSISERLQGIDAVRLESIADAPSLSLPSTSTGLKSDMLDRVLEGFHMLLYCPAEYLSKSSRADMLRRAVTFDMAVVAVKHEGDRPHSALKVVRTFLQRTFHALGSAEHQHTQVYLESLVRSVGSDGAGDVTTLAIIDAHVRAVFRMAQRGHVDAASKYVASLLPLQPKQSSPSVDERMDTLRERIMSVLVGELAAESLPGELKAALCTFQAHVVTRIESQAATLANGSPHSGIIVALASACLRFSAWLGIQVHTTPVQATHLIRLLLSESHLSEESQLDLSKAVFGLLIAEFESETGARENRLAEMLASYVALSSAIDSSHRKSLDDFVLGAARRFSVEEFALSLDLVGGMLCDKQAPGRLSCAVHLGSVLLQGAPEGTLKPTQTLFTRALCVFVDYPHCTSDHLLRADVLEFINQQCCERPASLRLINLTTLWPLLARNLSGTPRRDGKTRSDIFHKIVSVVGALIRLRRDLVVNTLPHLCIVLRMLVSSLRGPRPNLGEKQRRTVADSLPAWVDIDRPFGAEEGRALARLMTTLVTKTVVRVHANPSDLQKAESLARPLSKHVACVIQAYVEAVNDLLCVVPLVVRQELMPGLFVLCGMLNEHDRDALMVSSLDAAGKATLKALWKDYEKQRYVGKG